MMSYRIFNIVFFSILTVLISVNTLFSKQPVQREHYQTRATHSVYYATAYYYHYNKVPQFYHPIDKQSLHLFSQYYFVLLSNDKVIRFEHYENGVITARNDVLDDFVLSIRYSSDKKKVIEYRRLFYNKKNRLHIEEIYEDGFLESYYRYFYELDGTLRCIESIREHRLQSESCILKSDSNSNSENQVLNPFISHYKTLNSAQLDKPSPSMLALTKHNHIDIQLFNEPKTAQSNPENFDELTQFNTKKMASSPYLIIQSIGINYSPLNQSLSAKVQVKNAKGKITKIDVKADALDNNGNVLTQFQAQNTLKEDALTNPVQLNLKMDTQQNILEQIHSANFYLSFHFNNTQIPVTIGPYSIPIKKQIVSTLN